MEVTLLIPGPEVLPATRVALSEFCKMYRKVKIGELLLPTSLLNVTAMGTCSARCQFLLRSFPISPLSLWLTHDSVIALQ